MNPRIRRPESFIAHNRSNGREQVYLSTIDTLDDAPFLLSIKDWWIDLKTAKRIHAWLTKAIAYQEALKKGKR